ncbi:ASCH domain-containing protein [Gulosibacter faecalis]|uniref:ASCH domain-containing protein n=1 Tax=Gulosibacter faecalis TaxID=272240 RepID=A0ABW5UZX7_9MICO
MTRALLLSIKPQYARAILEGRKTIEVRRRFPNIDPGTTVVLYSSSPEKAVLGTVRLRRTIKISPGCVWALHGSDIGIDESDLNAYLAGADESTLLEVDCPESWEQPVSLNSLRAVLGIEPSQSFRYLATEQVEQAKQLSFSST